MTDQPWTVVASSYVRKDRWIAMREDVCRTAEGTPIAPYYVLEYPDWVHAVALGDDDRILLVRQYRHGAGRFTLEVPAGRIEPDEDPVEAACRELLEETGCAAREARLIHTGYANPANQTNRIQTVLCLGVEAVRAPLDDPAERVEGVWLPLDEALALAQNGGMDTNFQVASLLLALVETGRLKAG